MKSKNILSILTLLVAPSSNEDAVSNGTVGYLIAGIIALLIMGYLFYTLIHPDKF